MHSGKANSIERNHTCSGYLIYPIDLYYKTYIRKRAHECRELVSTSFGPGSMLCSIDYSRVILLEMVGTFVEEEGLYARSLVESCRYRTPDLAAANTGLKMHR